MRREIVALQRFAQSTLHKDVSYQVNLVDHLKALLSLPLVVELLSQCLQNLAFVLLHLIMSVFFLHPRHILQYNKLENINTIIILDTLN
jgi:hypothetical protein